MSGKLSELQDLFLNACRKQKIPVNLFLIKGVRLQGVIAGFGNFSLLLRREGAEQLAYKHGIASIAPLRLPEFEIPSSDREGLQDDFLLRTLGEDISVFLTSGNMLRGTLLGHDGFVILLDGRDGMQLLFKHAISTIQRGNGR